MVADTIKMLFRPEGRDIFLRFSNADGKSWIVPEDHFKTALCLYQPTGWKGRSLHRFFAWISAIPFLRKLAGMEIFSGTVDVHFSELMKDIFKTEQVSCSLFSGTPSIHQKITVQIFDRENILGYCKVTRSDEIAAIFSREAQVLYTLREKGVSHIPECLYNGIYRDDISIFVQNTHKSLKSTTSHSFTKHHSAFLQLLHEKTVTSLDYVDSDFYHSVSYLETQLSSFTATQREIISRVLKEVDAVFKKKSKVCFSAYHADFTPWNTYLEKGELYVFDFEYTKMSYPPYLDWFHFFTQVALFKHKANAQDIATMFDKERNKLNYFLYAPPFMYKCYLLDIISFYIHREKGNLEGDVERNMVVWIELLGLL
jgi:hypothetical protein